MKPSGSIRTAGTRRAESSLSINTILFLVAVCLGILFTIAPHLPLRFVDVWFVSTPFLRRVSTAVCDRRIGASLRFTEHFCSTSYSQTRKMASSGASYARERRIAELAVQRAAVLTKAVYTSRVKGTLTKSDKSPVTIADFGAQALVFGALERNFPADNIIGEEDSGDLSTNSELKSLVWDVVSTTLSETQGHDNELGTISGDGQMIEFIDKGGCTDSANGRVWALDPVDGTKGFLRGGQYAIALALLVDGVPQVGVLGCPNLPGLDGGEDGVILSAVRGQGTTVKPLSADLDTIEPRKTTINPIASASDASFCEGVESGHSAHDVQASIATKLGITKPSVQLDSQAKYASIALGRGELYLRLPISMTYEEKIWDHAAGAVVFEEAGGVVVDMYGRPLNFKVGRTLKENNGIIGMPKQISEEVMKVVREVAVEHYGPPPQKSSL
ncbi:Inositol-1-monophosphatase [Orbilia brochopaga]|nr:Inositol-1-monophosphatase [Drechslerella brochopaga]